MGQKIQETMQTEGEAGIHETLRPVSAYFRTISRFSDQDVSKTNIWTDKQQMSIYY